MWIIETLLISFTLYLLYSYFQNIQLLRTVTGLNRGSRSERKLVLQLLKMGISSNNIFHDLYIEKNDGTYSQVDVVVLTEVGVVVIEVKDYSGWIFGYGNKENWVQTLGKKKYTFYNPIFQNEGHIRSLKCLLNVYENVPYYSLIVFDGGCELKKISNIPNEISIIKLNKSIKYFKDILQNHNSYLNYNVTRFREVLNVGVENGGVKEIKSQHIRDLKRYKL
jgi:hypothetical protein